MTTYGLNGNLGEGRGAPDSVGHTGFGEAGDEHDATRRAVDYVVRLYVAGGTPVARRAEASLRQLMHLVSGNFDLEVIDVLANPAAAELAGVLATPLLVRELPLPRRRVVGDLSDRARVADALDLEIPPPWNGNGQAH